MTDLVMDSRKKDFCEVTPKWTEANKHDVLLVQQILQVALLLKSHGRWRLWL